LSSDKTNAIPISIVLLVIVLIAISILLGANQFVFKSSVTTTTTLTNLLTTQVTFVAPTTSTVVDTTSVTKTETITTTLQGIIPPINNVLVSNISLPSYTWGVTVNPTSNMIYAVAPLSNLSVINGTTNHVVASLELGRYGSDYVTVNPTMNLVYSGNSIINGSTNRVIGRFPFNVSDLVVDPLTNRIFSLSTDFAPPGNTSLLVSSGLNGSLIKRIQINGSATTLAVNSITHMVYVPVCSTGNVCAPIFLLALNETTMSIKSKTLIDSSQNSGIPFAITVNQETNMVYMTDQKLVSINGTTNTVTAQTTVSAFTIQCRGVAVNEKYNEIYVAGWGIGNYGSFFIVNGQNYSLLNAFAGTGQPIGIAFDPTNSEIYVANSQTKSVLALNSTAFVLS
jgi:DNA-binding beta-propeller fold protein YncE